MTPADLNAMADRWEADLAKLPEGSFARESLAQAIKDLKEMAVDELDSARDVAA